MNKKKKFLVILISAVLLISAGGAVALPAFAETETAYNLPGQPLSKIAAWQIINHSGLPTEILPDGSTNNVTHGRDAVNAYRYAHTMLSENGWYRGIGDDHTPLLVAMVETLEREGFTADKPTWEEKKNEVLRVFWEASDDQNAKDMGYNSLQELYEDIDDLKLLGRMTEGRQIMAVFKNKWK